MTPVGRMTKERWRILADVPSKEITRNYYEELIEELCEEVRLSWEDAKDNQRVVDAAFELSDNAGLTDKYCDQYFRALDEALEAIGRKPSYSEAGRVYEVNKRAMALMTEARRKRTGGDV